MYVLKITPPVFARHHEFSVRDELTALGFEVAVPTLTEIRPDKPDRITPIIRGYCFSEFPLERWDDVRSIVGVRGLLRIGADLARLTPREVSAVKTLSETVGHREKPSRFKHRQRIGVRRGAMATLQGLVNRCEAGVVVVDGVQMFGRTFNGIRIPIDDVEPAKEKAPEGA